MGPHINTTYEINTKRVINKYKCFGTIAQLLRPTKRAKLEHLSSITIGYLTLQKDSKSTKDFRTLKILLDSGCTATLINPQCCKNIENQ